MKTGEMAKMKIGEMAKIVDTNVETIRYYERIGLLPEAKRTKTGYREYDEQSVEQFDFIQKSQQLGFTLREIKELVAEKAINHKLVDKIKNLDKKLKELAEFKNDLMAMVDEETA